jgi:hypothetical protein
VIVTVPVGVIDEGAVKTPPEVMDPADALHVTEVCPDAVNVCVPLRATETVDGDTVIGPPVTTAGFKVIVDVEDLLASAALVAVTVTVVFAEMFAGAV